MNTTLFGLLLAAVSPVGEAAGLELNYTGSLTQVATGDTVKEFEIYALLTKSGDGHTVSFYVVDDLLPWPERVGRTSIDAGGVATGKPQIEILYEHDGTDNPLAVRAPLFDHTARLARDAAWEDGTLRYEVTGQKKVQDRNVWQVEAAANLGRSFSLSVEAETGLIVAADQRVFMGRGDQFRLRVELASAKPADAARVAQLGAPLDQLIALRRTLARKEGQTTPELNDLQLEQSEAALEKLTVAAAGTPFEDLVTAITRDVRLQKRRSGDVATLSKKYVGQPAPRVELKGLDGRSVDSADHDGKIVLLHFWKYHDEPLKEPYGQVGYLDYLNSRRNKLGVKVYGVAVDPRIANPNTSGAAVRQIRKLREFMNLGYPVTMDDGTLLKKFGDPQKLGASLPLWVAIAPDGKIVHYKVGFYDLKPDEGLRELDDILVEEIRKQRAAEEAK